MTRRGVLKSLLAAGIWTAWKGESAAAKPPKMMRRTLMGMMITRSANRLFGGYAV